MEKIEIPQRVKCGMCSFQLEPQWKECKWCGDCKVFLCARCRGGIKSTKCGKCKKPILKLGVAGLEFLKEQAKKKKKTWVRPPGGEALDDPKE